MNGTAFAFMAGVSMAIESGIETVVCATAPETAQIRIIGNQDFGNWDDYVGAHAHGTPFHLIAWKNAITLTVTDAEPMFPAVSDAFTVSVCVPFPTAVEVHPNANGDALADETRAPSTKS